MIVAAPIGGTVVGLEAVPDEVFAAGMVGPGTAVEPTGPGVVEVLAPVAGTLIKIHPHAFALRTADAIGVLVHLGVDTVRLRGEGFEVLRAEGEVVDVGDPVVRWSPDDVRTRGLSAVCPVVVLDVDPTRVTAASPVGDPVAAGAPLLDVVAD